MFYKYPEDAQRPTFSHKFQALFKVNNLDITRGTSNKTDSKIN